MTRKMTKPSGHTRAVTKINRRELCQKMVASMDQAVVINSRASANLLLNLEDTVFSVSNGPQVTVSASLVRMKIRLLDMELQIIVMEMVMEVVGLMMSM
jgi:hypothetical protein